MFSADLHRIIGIPYQARYAKWKQRVRRKIKETVSNLPDCNTNLDDEYEDLIDLSHSKIFRVLWFLILLGCLLICCYQISDRVQYFLSNPLAVDFHIGDMKELKMPSLLACAAENDYVVKLLDSGESESDLSLDLTKCFLPFMKLLGHDSVDYSKVFDYSEKIQVLKGYEYTNDVNLGQLHFKTLKTVFGKCVRADFNRSFTGKETRARVKVNINKGRLCTPALQLASLADKSDFAILVPTISGFTTDFKIMFRKYKFMNNPNNPCVSNEDFTKCYRKCVASKLANDCPCRYPFFPLDIKLPDCNPKEKDIAKQSMICAAHANLKPNVYDEHGCACIRSCDEYVYITSPNVYETDVNSISLILSIDPIDVAITERPAYDLTALLTDVGGNLGLLMGLSILSIFNIVQNTMNSIRRKAKVQRMTRTQQLIAKKYFKYWDKYNGTLKPGETDMKSNSNGSLWIVALLVFMSAGIYISYLRITYYFLFKTRMIVDVKHQSLINFPSLTVCGETFRISSNKKKFARSEWKNQDKWCDVQLLDLLNGYNNKWTLDYLWKYSKIETPMQLVTGILNDFNLTLINAQSETTIATHMGNCIHYKFEKVEYSGFFHLFPIPFASLSTWPVFSCSDSSIKFFYSSETSSHFDRFDVMRVGDSPVQGLSAVDFRYTYLLNLNSSTNPCTGELDFEKCKKDCLFSQLENAGLCKLPFLDSFIDNLTTCDTPKIAKETLKKFLRINTSVNKKACHCTRPCNETVPSFTVVTIAVSPNMKGFAIVMAMLSNIAETVKEVRSYSLISLCCDIGNCFGLTLGMSVLTFIRFVRLCFSCLPSVFLRLQK